MHFDNDDIPSNPSSNPSLQQLVQRAISRRTVLKSGLGIAALPFFGGLAACGSGGDSGTPAAVVEQLKPLKNAFVPLPASSGHEVVVPEGYVADVLYRWGDPLKSSAAYTWRGDATEGWIEQENQAGDNHDGMSYFPLAKNADGASESGLLVMNHEYVNYEYFFAPDTDPANWLEPWNADKAKKAQAAHGVSVVEVRRARDGRMSYVPDSQYNRRITGYTEIDITGPAAGADALRTSADPTGTRVLGTLNNCANGKTPWGTYLTCEENFNGYFGSTDPAYARTDLERRYGVSTSSGYRWHEVDERFDISKNPNEPNRFGWIVEIDPYDPESKPRKRTALGRFKHENAEVVVAKDGRVVVYMGDDQANDYIYKFVSDGKYDPSGTSFDSNLLDSGTLYVARFDAGDVTGDFKGTGEWLPLVQGRGPLTDANGFATQADVLINARGAADLLGATKMDRPEWIAANPRSLGEVFCTLTNNSGRTATDDANPRAANRFGQIVRWNEAGGDPTATSFEWDLFLIAGNPIAFPDRSDLNSGSAIITAENTFNSPDGLAFDYDGRLWIQTDGNFSNTGRHEGQGNNQMLVADLKTGELQRFLVGPSGCEVTGLAFTPDMRTMFVNIQHPGEIGSHPDAPKKPDGSVYGDNDIARDPTAFTRWPDGATAGRPRSATVVVRRADGRKLLG
ncbi:PhoX family phosphatase [Burkholderiaceae bacterium FT117]|uniref:PhoX family protein n=1 Tax=Zeimonas sediminis TaxID=2944268 RepID=UPI002342EE5A|nr:PhoX family phosphatase [Zeimonas sediminis]MCM5571747.1 PhoX family phosphatase [Zeimonas sediminis]